MYFDQGYTGDLVQRGLLDFYKDLHHRCAQAKILDRGHKYEKIKGVIKNPFRGGLELGVKTT